MPTWLTALLAAVLATLARDIARDVYGAAKNNWKQVQRWIWIAIILCPYFYLAFFFRPSDPVKPHELTIGLSMVAFMAMGASGLLLQMIGRIVGLLELTHRDTKPDAK